MACYSVDLSLTNLILLGAIVFAIKKLIKLYQKWNVDKMLAHFENTPKDKVILHGLWRCKVMPSISSFALKLETYLRMAKISYELETKSPMGPLGKTPWITLNGTHVADSQLCIQYLNKKFSINLNKSFTPEQIGIAQACRVMLENHCVWGLVQYRLIENGGKFSELLKIPAVFKLTIPLMRWRVKKRMDDNGIGKHTPTEIYQMTEEDLRSVSIILGKKKFITGDEPCEEDCAIFGFVAQAVWGLPGSTFERLVHGELSNLKEYCERMKERYWPDWESCMDRS